MSDKYSLWKQRAESHDQSHDLAMEKFYEDFSCEVCYPTLVTSKKFIRFWKWYEKEIPEVMNYTIKTEEIFLEVLESIKEQDTKRLKNKIGILLRCMRYKESPKLTEKEIEEKIIRIAVITRGFEQASKEILKEHSTGKTEDFTIEE